MTQEQRRREMYPAFLSALECVDRKWAVPVFEDDFLNTLVRCYSGGISRRQAIINFTKWMHGFNITRPEQDLIYMREEMQEADDAFLHEDAEAFLREIADIVIYGYGIAQMFQIDLDSVIEDKMKYNLERSYEKEE